MQQTGSGENAVITKVTWTGRSVPTDEDAAFAFLAALSSAAIGAVGVLLGGMALVAGGRRSLA